MISGRIWCSYCGHEGPREIKGIIPAKSTADVFRSEGHDPYSGKLYFRCPRCRVFISVDPHDALGSDTMNGYPPPVEVSRLTEAQNFFTVLGGMYASLIAVILFIQIVC
jgi:hypothetical protein